MANTVRVQSGSEAILVIGKTFFDFFNLNDPDRRKVYERVFYVLMENTRSQQFSDNPKKGILLNGSLGVGKTTLMRIMQQILIDTPRKFRWVTGKDLLKMQEDIKTSELLEMYGKSMKMDLYIDDIGIGQADKNKYGNWSNLIADLVFERYELYITEGYRTHFSCNLPTDFSEEERHRNPGIVTIKDLYGDRVLDRIRELTNLITWTGASLRRRK